MQRILLNCKSAHDANFLKSYLENELPYEVSVAFGHRDMETSLGYKPTHLLILQTGSVMDQDIQYVQNIRQSGFQNPILLITEAIGNHSPTVLAEKYKAFFLERPFELRNLKGLARKLMVNKSTLQQIHRRHLTNQTATVESFTSTERILSKMFNLSVGGAYFEFSKRPLFNVGELMKVKVNLPDLEREHQINGRVVWTTHKGHVSGGYGVGIRFVKSSEIYRQLLGNM